jgi:predicted dehydrogenase
MNKDWFVEEGPWEIAGETIRGGRLGRVAEVCLQEIVEAGSANNAGSAVRQQVNLRKSQLAALFGPPARESALDSELAASVLLQFQDGMLITLFVDAATCGSTASLDFEVIGTRESLIFRSGGGCTGAIQTEISPGVYAGRLFRRSPQVADLESWPHAAAPVRLGVISLDHPHARGNHFPALRRLGRQIQVRAIADGDQARCAPWLQLFGARYYATRDELLADREIDAVLVTSQNWRHAEDAVAAARAGKDIFCDKPIVTTSEQAADLARACRETGVRFVTTYPCRFSPEIQALRQNIRDGRLGRVQAIQATNHGCMYEPGAPDWVKDPRRNGGGCIIDHTVHVADLMRYLTGQEFADVRTFAATALHEIAAEDLAASHGTMTGGTLFQIDCSWSRKPSDPPWGDVTLRVAGTRGSASLDLYNSQKVELFGGGGVELRYSNNLCHQHAMIFLDYQAEKSSGRRGENADAGDGLRTMDLVFASYESLRQGRRVALPEIS